MYYHLFLGREHISLKLEISNLVLLEGEGLKVEIYKKYWEATLSEDKKSGKGP